MPRAGIEPARCQAPRDFKSLASTNSATQAPQTTFASHPALGGCLKPDCLFVQDNQGRDFPVFKATTGFEPVIEVLQTSALPLGDVAGKKPVQSGIIKW